MLKWSGDERYFTTPNDPNVAAMAGWQRYEGVMPKDVEIVKMGIVMLKTDSNSAACIGPGYNGTWYGEDWTPVDEITFTDTILCNQNLLMDDELLWESDEVTLDGNGRIPQSVVYL